MQTVSNSIIVEKVKDSKIDKVDFNNLSFGKYFTDHMMVCNYKNGAWEVPKIVPY